MYNCYFIIQPHFSDFNTYCEFTVGNSMTRARLNMGADEHDLWGVVTALRSEDLNYKHTSLEEFSLTDEWCRAIAFCVFKMGDNKVLRTTIVNDADCPDGEVYRAQIDIPLNKEEAEDLAAELETWLKNPVYSMVWKDSR